MSELRPRGGEKRFVIFLDGRVLLGRYLLFQIGDTCQPEMICTIWFTIWSSVAHGGLMLVQSFDDRPHRLAHLRGDVPLLLFGAALVAWLMPCKVGHIQA